MNVASITKVYGASDDLVYACDEEMGSYGKPTYLRFNDGTYVEVRYDSEGCWRVKVLKEGGAKRTKLFGIPDDGDNAGQVHNDPDAPSYSDVLILTWTEPLEIVQRGKSPLKEPPKGLKIAKAVIKALEDRGGFDSWWCDVDDDSKMEILEEIAKVVEGAK